MNYKMVKFKLSSWKKLRRAFYGRQNETFSDYIERISNEITNLRINIITREMENE